MNKPYPMSDPDRQKVELAIEKLTEAMVKAPLEHAAAFERGGNALVVNQEIQDGRMKFISALEEMIELDNNAIQKAQEQEDIECQIAEELGEDSSCW